RRRSETLSIDVQELSLIEGVDEVCPELEARSTNETHGFRHRKIPLLAARQTEGCDGRRAIFPWGSRHESRGVEPQQTVLVAGAGVADLIGPQRLYTPAAVAAVGCLKTNGGTRFDPRNPRDLPLCQQRVPPTARGASKRQLV